MKILKIIYLCAFACLTSIEVNAQNIQINARPSQKTYILGEPIVITIEINNPSDNPVLGSFYPTQDQALQIVNNIKKADTSVIWIKPMPANNINISTTYNILTIKPQSVYKQDYYLTPYAILKRAGNIPLSVLIHFQLMAKNVTKSIDQNTDCIISVSDQNDAALAAKLKDLSNSILLEKRPRYRDALIHNLCSYTSPLAIDSILLIYAQLSRNSREDMIPFLTTNPAIGYTALKHISDAEHDQEISEIIKQALKETKG